MENESAEENGKIKRGERNGGEDSGKRKRIREESGKGIETVEREKGGEAKEIVERKRRIDWKEKEEMREDK